MGRTTISIPFWIGDKVWALERGKVKEYTILSIKLYTHRYLLEVSNEDDRYSTTLSSIHYFRYWFPTEKEAIRGAKLNKSGFL